MGKESPRLRRANSLIAYWQGGRLSFHNYAARQTISSNPVAIDILGFFDKWRRTADAIAHFTEYTPASVRRAIRGLAANRLLLEENSQEARLDDRIAKEWKPWLPLGAFHFSTKDTAYVRSNWSDERLRATLPDTPQPAKFKSIKGAPKVALPPRTFPDSEFLRILMERKTHREFARPDVSLENVSQLLSLVWGVTGYYHTTEFGNLPRKTSPSGGARHPGEVYLMALRVKGLKPGLYHYRPEKHQLETVKAGATGARASQYCAHQEHVGKAAALFLMTAVFPRNMWKYHKPRAYRVVLLDAGHLCQTFCLVATWLGLAPFCTAALQDTMIEQDLGIDGVRESILYVAGVGMPVPASARKSSA
jgi:SagB-type dehydrogenase family enzyme